jgi:hypothetical protein
MANRAGLRKEFAHINQGVRVEQITVEEQRKEVLEMEKNKEKMLRKWRPAQALPCPIDIHFIVQTIGRKVIRN